MIFKIVFYVLDFATKALFPKYRKFKQANLFQVENSIYTGKENLAFHFQRFFFS